MDKYSATVALQGKSLGLGVVLSIIFGGVGMFYLGIWWGLIGLFMEGILAFFTLITGGLMGFLLGLWHIVSVIITVVSINRHNSRILNSLN